MHSLRPKRPPSYPLKEEPPPPQAPTRQHQGSARQGSSRTSSGQSHRAQAAVTRPTQKVRTSVKGKWLPCILTYTGFKEQCIC